LIVARIVAIKIGHARINAKYHPFNFNKKEYLAISIK